jgi:DNA-binding IclR family transcriptional regulator
MASPVPALDRAMNIFDLLSQKPLDRLTLSEIARATGIHKATCASMLATMVSHGLIRRDEGRRYSVGSRLVKLGYSYTQRFPPLVVGRTDVLKFVARSGLSCAVLGREDGELVVLDILGNAEPAHLYMRIGDRVPLVPPVGTIYKAWADREELDNWLEEMSHEFGGNTASYEAAVAALRVRGFSLGGEHDFNLELEDALQAAQREGEDSRVLEVALIVANKIRNYTAAEGTDAEPINSVIAPIFDSSAQVVATLNAFGEFGSVRMGDLPRIVPDLLATGVAITQKSGGILPAGFPIS